MLALGCACGAGFSPYGTILIVGLILRADEQLRPAGGVTYLMSPFILWPAALLFAVDLVVSKVPRWDVRWHLRQGWVRVVAAALLVFLAGGTLPLDVRILMVVLGAVAALAVHVARTGIHIGIHGAGTAAFAIPLAGVVEDCLLFGILLPLSAGRPGLTLMMLGVVAVSLALSLALIWADARTVLWNMLLGAEEKPQRTGE